MAIACLYGDADKRSAAARAQRTPNPNRAAVGGDRPAPSNRHARVQPNSSPVLSRLGSAVLDLVLALVACVWRIADSGKISNSPHTGRLDLSFLKT